MFSTRWCINFCLLIIFIPLHADYFSQIAEAHNVLDRLQLNWSNKPFPVELKLYGFVKAESIFDTRQNFELRDGNLLYFPLQKMPDVTGADINARGDFDIYAIASRISLAGIGPDIGCFKSSFLIEGDFFGRTDPVINSFDLWLAYLKLENDLFEFLAGQDFHPIMVPFESPATISYNMGIPITPFALCPQFKVTYHTDSVEFLAAASGFLGDRPFGVAGGTDKVFRDAIMPDFYIQAKLKGCDTNYVGAGFDVNRIIPRLVTNKNYKEVSPLTQTSYIVFGHYQVDRFSLYSKLMYSNDGALFELIGGIAVKTVDPVTDKRTYVPLRSLACYAELIYEGPIEPGIFIGAVKNLGAGTTIIPSLEDQETIYGIGININTVFRVSPRIRWYINSFIVGLEYEYTRASYGMLDNRANVINTIPVANNRLLFATYYMF